MDMKASGADPKKECKLRINIVSLFWRDDMRGLGFRDPTRGIESCARVTQGHVGSKIVKCGSMIEHQK